MVINLRSITRFYLFVS